MITKYFEEKSGAKTVVEMTDPELLMWNDGSIECQTGELFYGFVKRLKPKNILETGCYKGWSTAYLAQGVKENGFGSICTVEYECQHIQTSKELWKKLELNELITVYQEDVRKFTPSKRYQLFISDTEPELRFDEVIRFYPYIDDGGYIFIHDLPRNMTQGNINPDHKEIQSWPFGNLPKQIQDWVDNGDLRPFTFPGGRGLWGFYKKHKEDYL